MNNVKDAVLGFGGIATFGFLWILLSLAVSAASLIITCLIIYFFLAAAGVFPPIDFVPLIPFV